MDKLDYCVVYRTGGTVNYKWQRSASMTKAQASQVAQELEHKGYKAMRVLYAHSVAAGLPEGYEYGTQALVLDKHPIHTASAYQGNVMIGRNAVPKIYWHVSAASYARFLALVERSKCQ